MNKHVRNISILFMFVLLLFSLCSCSISASNALNKKTVPTVTVKPTETPTKVATAVPTTKPTAKPISTTKTTTSSSVTRFTNKYGTSTTVCAYAGCRNYIASSGDTAYCTSHSRKCAECKKYVDADATYCMDCIKEAAGKVAYDSGKKCSYCSKTASKMLIVTQPSGESAAFAVCNNCFSEYKAFYNSKKGWSAY